MSSQVPRRGVFARLSLEHKLPMLMGGLLLLVILALSTAAYLDVRRSAVRTSAQHLSTIVLDLRDNFQQSAAQMHALIKASASTSGPTLAEYVRDHSESDRSAAVAALEFVGPGAAQVIGSELRDSSGRVLLSTVPAGFAFDTMLLVEARRAAARDSTAIGRFRAVASMPDTLVFPVVAPVANGAGYLVRWRRMAGSRRQRELVSRLIGSDASIFLGNPDGVVGTDLEHTASRPPLPIDTPGATHIYRRGEGVRRYLASNTAIPGTPWTIVADMPMAAIEGPVSAFMRRLALIAAIALLLGLGAAWIASRRISKPLIELSDAAGAIASGDFSREVQIRRSDELGRLGSAFSAMASEVRQTRENLENRIAERTRDLDSTLRQLQEAQDTLVRRERLALLGQLSSGVGHELRNPLGVMTNAVYFLRTVLKASPPKVQEYLGILQQQITLSEKIVSDLLDFARQKPPQRKPTLLREATEAQLAKLGRIDGMQVELVIPDDLSPVLVDPIQLGQVILNLLTNASQAMDGGGHVTVKASANGQHVCYEVGDTGPGILPENIERIFEPLFTTKARGIGLGLSVSRMLARANGGDLTATSTPGQGATFTLTLEKAEATT